MSKTEMLSRIVRFIFPSPNMPRPDNLKLLKRLPVSEAAADSVRTMPSLTGLSTTGSSSPSPSALRLLRPSRAARPVYRRPPHGRIHCRAGWIQMRITE